jgi:hypothetical protein
MWYVRSFICVSDGQNLFTLNVCPYYTEHSDDACGFEPPVSHVCSPTINQPNVFSSRRFVKVWPLGSVKRWIDLYTRGNIG